MGRTMTDKQKRAINKGRKKAGLKPIKFFKVAKAKKLTKLDKVKRKTHAIIRKGNIGNW